MRSLTFGQIFKMLRVEMGFTQEELIENLKDYGVKVSKSVISSYENDKLIPENDLLLFFANYFNVSTDFLLANSSIRNPDIKSNFIASISNLLIKNGIIKDCDEELTEEKLKEIETIFEKVMDIYNKKEARLKM